MLLLLPLVLITVIQVLSYVYLDQKGWNHWKLVLFLVFIPLYIFVVAPIYVSYSIPQKEGEIGCGMPALSLFLLVLLLGIGGLFFTHLLYWIFRKRKKK